MADLNLTEEMVVLGGLKGWNTHTNIEVVISDTLKQGSILDSSGNELEQADASSSRYVVNDLNIRRWLEEYDTGDTLLIAVVNGGCILNEDACVYSDGDITADGQTVLRNYKNKFSTISLFETGETISEDALYINGDLLLMNGDTMINTLGD